MVLCRLCSAQTLLFCVYKEREYHRCPQCFLIQLRRSQCPSFEDEQAEYMLHRNDPHDQGYRRFLSPVTNAMLEWLDTEQRQNPQILDFGAGSGPTISVVLEEQGWKVHNYDPFFFPDRSALARRYDLISCTEVVEHFYEPQRAWELLMSLRTDHGQVVVMTQCSDAHFTAVDFQAWRYIQEKSHVAFYHSKTMFWIAKHYGLQVSRLSPSVFWFS